MHTCYHAHLRRDDLRATVMLYLQYWFLILGPILLFTVLTHELGHCMAARQVGGHAESILLWPLGGLAYIGHNQGPKGMQARDRSGITRPD